MTALHSRIYDSLTLADVVGARQSLERLAALARTLRDPLYEHFVVGWTCNFAQMDGRLEEAEQLALQSFEMRRALETRDAESVLAAQLFMIRRAQGRVHELLPAVAAAVEEHPMLSSWRAALPLVYAAEGDEQRARAELGRMVDGLAEIPRDFFWLTSMWLLSEAAAALGDAGLAERLYSVLAPFASRWIQIGYAAGDGPVARVLGLLAAACGDTERAVAHLEDALRACALAPAFAVRAHADLADALGPCERSRTLASQALALARGLDMPAAAERLLALS
jgi:hypothetical protein